MDYNVQLLRETKQILSQNQIESLRILSLPQIELHEFLQKEESENPLLEYAMSEKESGGVEENQKVLVYNQQNYGASRRDSTGCFNVSERAASEDDEIRTLVFQQITKGMLTIEEYRVARYATELLDSNGFLTSDAEEIAFSLKIKTDVVVSCIEKLKKLKPTGIFSENLQECLEKQVEGRKEEGLLKRIIREHLTDIAEGKISEIGRELKISTSAAKNLVDVIRQLNPRPLNGTGSKQTQYIVPDIIFCYEGSKWTIELNEMWGESTRLNTFYLDMMQKAKDEESKRFFEQKLKRAKMIISAVEQRKNTLIEISKFVLEKQNLYFLTGKGLQRMTIKETAVFMGLNASTVSRAIKDKYISFPKGSIALRKLFVSGGVQNVIDGDVISKEAVKEIMCEILRSEDKNKPYSDEKVAFYLEKHGVCISRRTVAKYRNELEIPGQFERKHLCNRYFTQLLR